MNNELKHFGVLGMKWGTHLSKEVRGVKKAYKTKSEKQLQQYQKRMENHASDLQNKLFRYYYDLDKAQNRNDNAKADRISKKIFNLENEIGRGHNKIGRDYDELVKKSKKQYDKDLEDARLKAYNRLYRRPFGRNELKHFGVLGMKWGKRKDKSKSLGPVKTSIINGRKYYHDDHGVAVAYKRDLKPAGVRFINKQRSKGVDTLKAMSKLDAIDDVKYTKRGENLDSAHDYAKRVIRDRELSKDRNRTLVAYAAIGGLAAKSLLDRNRLAGINNREYYATVGVAAVAGLYASGISSMVARSNINKRNRKLEESYRESGGGS